MKTHLNLSTENPPLERALDAVPNARLGTHDHYGIYVDGVEDVEGAIERLAKAGFDSSIEREQTCCYANQTKVWAHEETADRDSADTTCCAQD